MIKALSTVVLTLLPLLSVPAFAGDPSADRVNLSKLEQTNIGNNDKVVTEDRQLEMKKADFLKFAAAKILEMNRNHILSRERMQINKNANGLYRAMFHEIDDTSLSCQLSRSRTGTSPYVAVLTYRELVYSTSCATPEACRQSQFQPVEVIPNRHIFTYSNGTWQ